MAIIWYKLCRDSNYHGEFVRRHQRRWRRWRGVSWRCRSLFFVLGSFVLGSFLLGSFLLGWPCSRSCSRSCSGCGWNHTAASSERWCRCLLWRLSNIRFWVSFPLQNVRQTTRINLCRTKVETISYR